MRDQDGNALIENDKLVKADDLAKILCQLFQDGEICIQSVTGFTLTQRGEDVILTLHTTGENYSVNLSDFFKDTFLDKAVLGDDNVITLTKNDGTEIAKLDLNKFYQGDAHVAAKLEGKTIVFDKANGDTADKVDLSSITRTDAEVAGVFMTCGAQKHTPGNLIPTCEEMNNAIAEAIRNLPRDKFANAFVRDGNKIKLTISDGTEMEIDVSDLAPVKVGNGLTGDGTEGSPISLSIKTAPAEATVSEAEDGEIATTYYGGHNKIMGEPAAWVELVPGYLLPVYRKA